MITDPRVFEDEYLPRELNHREAQVEELSRAFRPVLDHRPAEHVLISGPSGVGKTALARYALQQLESAVDDPHGHTHLHCLGMTTGELLRSILREHPSSIDVPLNTPVEELPGMLRDAVRDPYIVVLDEADGLPTTDALQHVTGLSTVSLVAICHDPDAWLARAPPELQQGIRCHITLGRYGVGELADILDDRVSLGLAPNTITRSQLEMIADGVAGVARYGIQALRAAAELASETGHQRIRDEDVVGSFDRARRQIREVNLRSLPFHHHVLYAIVQSAGELEASQLHAQYEAVAEELYYGRELVPIGRRSRRNKLAKLQEYDLIGADGPAQRRVYSVLDESIESPLELAALKH